MAVKKTPIPEQLDELLNRMKPRAGPTGKFPDGQLNEMDEGELAVAVGVEGGKVVIQFGKEISWVALRPEQAEAFCATVAAMAARIRRGE